MKISGTQQITSRVQVDVEPREAFKELIIHMYRNAGISSRTNSAIGAFVHDGKIVYEEEYTGSHTSWETIVLIEEPSQEQIDVVNAVNFLYKFV